MKRPPGDGNALIGRYFPGMEIQRAAPEHGTGGVIAAAGLGLLAVGGWVVSDSLMGRAVRLRYATQSPPPIVETTPTVWGWCALILAVIGALSVAASTTWVLVMWRGFATGWTERAVPVVPAWLARAAAAGVAALVALALAVAIGLPAVVGVGAAALAGYVAAEIALDAVQPCTIRALIMQMLDPLLGWPGPGGIRRLHRVKLRNGEPVQVEVRVGPGWSADSLTAVIDAADRSPAAPLDGLTWGYDARRRLLIGVQDDRGNQQ